jgi:hypothetical protein
MELIIAGAIVIGSLAVSITIWMISLRLVVVCDHLYKIVNMLSGIFMKLEHIKFELFSISSKLSQEKSEKGGIINAEPSGIHQALS